MTALKNITLSILLMSLPLFAHAADGSYGAVVPAPSVAHTFTIPVLLHTDTQSFNVIEGSLKIPSDLSIDAISTGGSALSLWTARPHYVVSTGSIDFTGGVPGGIPTESTVTLFTITAHVTEPGTYTVGFNALSGFKNDGSGTLVAISGVSSKISVVTDGSESPLIQDTTAPEFVSVSTGSDTSLFGGKTYVTFFATDDQSGVASYAVKEGFLGAYHTADQYYVLKDQEQSVPVWVRVTDAHGNTTVKEIPPLHPRNNFPPALAGLGILLLGLVLSRTLKRK